MIDVNCRSFAHNAQQSSIDTNGWELAWQDAQDEIKEDLKNKIPGIVDGNGIFLISAFDEDEIKVVNERIDVKFPGFEGLKAAILNSLPKIQKTAMLFLMKVDSKAMMENKIEELKSRLWKVALLSAVSAAIPVPGINILADIAIFENEIRFQKKQLHIDVKPLQARAEKLDLDVEDYVTNIFNEIKDVPESSKSLLMAEYMKGEFDIKTFLSLLTKISAFGAGLVVSQAAEETVKYAAPIVGSVVAAALSGASTYGIIYFALSLHGKIAKSAMDIETQITLSQVTDKLHKILPLQLNISYSSVRNALKCRQREQQIKDLKILRFPDLLSPVFHQLM